MSSASVLPRYAVARYIDRWFRLGQTPPVTRAFLALLRRAALAAGAMGWILLAAGGVIVVTTSCGRAWMRQFANIVMLGVLGVIAAYVFFVMAALDMATHSAAAGRAS